MAVTFYNSIEKISSKLLILNSNFVLKHNVRVSHKNQDGRKELFHSEYTYMSQTSYSDIKYLKSIKLDFNSFLTIEETSKEKSWQDKESILINSTNILKFKKALKKAKKWFYKYKDLYFYDDDKSLVLNKEIAKGLSQQIVMGDKVLIIQPTIIYKGESEIEGINMYINRSSCVCQLTIDRLEMLHYIIKKIDLYMAGLSMINYLGRPDPELFNKDIGVEKSDVNNFYTQHQYSKGMQALQNSMKETKNEFSSYFK